MGDGEENCYSFFSISDLVERLYPFAIAGNGADIEHGNGDENDAKASHHTVPYGRAC